ncbi:endolytic transglycosylase MltG [Sphingomonas sinipercae]|uniref:Endolytic murein transglycosylase n=1 Tax=Sphingomonas sinipercae TaxID=2714944 RepID=A0A6G7ZMS4_9SPHN|nr:endolytic transglycosylase MltG [Sphingomonas sinipercae]QIL02284.1 endolytic transglycosylase MltG [Sphingomonas sinipercae]
MRKLAGVAILAGLAALLLLWGLWWRGGDNDKPVNFIVEQGSSIASVANKLEKAGLIRSATSFRGFAKVLGGGDPVQAGEFEIPPHSSPAGILRLLQHGEPIQRLVTVTEGMPSIIVQERLLAIPFLTGSLPEIAEGSLLPDSYSYERGESRAAVVGRMQKAMAKTVQLLWAKRKANCPVNTPEEAVTLASIVEKETGKAAERRTIAGVYCNRLKIGMKLDADPTVIYPVTKGKPLGRRILRSELNADTGYNTYKKPGLPAGPIANPGRDSIAAVLDPAPTKALYFVADGTGGHVFAATFAEHQANVQRWYAIRRQRGEM